MAAKFNHFKNFNSFFYLLVNFYRGFKHILCLNGRNPKIDHL